MPVPCLCYASPCTSADDPGQSSRRKAGPQLKVLGIHKVRGQGQGSKASSAVCPTLDVGQLIVYGDDDEISEYLLAWQHGRMAGRAGRAGWQAGRPQISPISYRPFRLFLFTPLFVRHGLDGGRWCGTYRKRPPNIAGVPVETRATSSLFVTCRFHFSSVHPVKFFQGPLALALGGMDPHVAHRDRTLATTMSSCMCTSPPGQEI